MTVVEPLMMIRESGSHRPVILHCRTVTYWLMLNLKLCWYREVYTYLRPERAANKRNNMLLEFAPNGSWVEPYNANGASLAEIALCLASHVTGVFHTSINGKSITGRLRRREPL